MGIELNCGSKVPEMRDVSRVPSRLNTAFFKTPGNLKFKTQILNNRQIIMNRISLLVHRE